MMAFRGANLGIGGRKNIWYWVLNNEQYLGIQQWDGVNFNSPGADEREILIRGRTEFDAAQLKANTATYEIDDRIPEDVAAGLVDWVMYKAYWNKPAQSTAMQNHFIKLARHHRQRWRQQTQNMQQYFGKNRRTSAGHIVPFQL